MKLFKGLWCFLGGCLFALSFSSIIDTNLLLLGIALYIFALDVFIVVILTYPGKSKVYPAYQDELASLKLELTRELGSINQPRFDSEGSFQFTGEENGSS